MTEEQFSKKETKDWEEFVRSEVTALLDTFLPASINGNVGIRYKKPLISEMPGGVNPIYDESKAEAVQISLVFQFEKPIDIPTEENAVEQ